MRELKYKIKISILWLSFAIASSAAMITWFLEPGIIQELMTNRKMATEDLSGANIILFSLWWLIPISMAFLTQVLENSLNRFLNIIIGILFSLLTIYYFINLIINEFYFIPNLLILFFSTMISIIITWLSWNYPKYG